MREDAGMRCEVAREALSARLDGERHAVPAQRVDAHLGSCPDCRAWLIGWPCRPADWRRRGRPRPGPGRQDHGDGRFGNDGAASALAAPAGFGLPAMGTDRRGCVPGRGRLGANRRNRLRIGVPARAWRSDRDALVA
ncbi:zinc-finger family protein [Mycobacterium xenopi 3993]|nr:zinc-finger family protein [Mycobacterium xenopi 3993]